MPDFVDRLSIDKIFESAVPVRADDQHIRSFFLRDPGDLPAAMSETKVGMASESFLFQHIPVEVQSFLVPSRLIVVTFFTQHPGAGALHHMDQQISAVLSTLTDSIGQ